MHIFCGSQFCGSCGCGCGCGSQSIEKKLSQWLQGNIDKDPGFWEKMCSQIWKFENATHTNTRCDVYTHIGILTGTMKIMHCIEILLLWWYRSLRHSWINPCALKMVLWQSNKDTLGVRCGNWSCLWVFKESCDENSLYKWTAKWLWWMSLYRDYPMCTQMGQTRWLLCVYTFGSVN